MIMNKLLPLLSLRLRNVSTVAGRSCLKRSVTTSSSLNADELREVEDFGIYNVILPEEPFVWGVSHITRRPVPNHILRPKYAARHDRSMSSDTDHEEQYDGDGRIRLGSVEEKRVRAAATLARNVRQYAGSLVQPGVTTNSIDAAIHNFIIAHEAYPSPLLYKGFPRSCCTSVNNVVSHGIPDDRPLQDGDIINIDVTIYLNGYHGDTSAMFLVGDVDEPGRDLLVSTLADLVRPFNAIGRAIYETIRNTRHSVCPAFAGHGIGTVFHRPPWIYHTLNEEPGVMLPGHCFTIEPSLVQGSDPSVWIFPDGWTASTENCARSAQAEHMILITDTGIDILTQ
ncbi:peptidase M24, structural domain-containing protein [Suillus paluster]|uniref:peptidase M24, structural domain-containing protein n=1 Tax=Suillus paluster TaxID=48578 RepID=UPI001B85EC4C|nr:peptidase M24, structural domain-containing protein [Suillus paluster]KAG1717468.1 peptidase M24, structural domain-containing protein [Suillus paluster]